MLYDNALLSRLYLHLYQITKDEFARRIVEETLDYVLREMTDASGGFYSTQDADSEGHEGKFFVWTPEEIEEALGPTDGAMFCAYYDVSASGNFEGANILHVTRTLEAVAAQFGVSAETLNETLARGRRFLFEKRELRTKPARDEKVITAWNGLMLVSFAEASIILNRDDYRAAAIKNAQFLLTSLTKNGLLLRTWKDGAAKLNAYLDDYACLIDGLVTLFEVTGDLAWIEEAIVLSNTMVEEFWDADDGGFFYTGKSHETLIVRFKDFLDNATPSGNSVAAEVFLRLGSLLSEEGYARKAINILRLQSESLERYPSAFGRALSALDFYLAASKEIAVIGDPATADTQELLRAIWSRFMPNRVIATGNDADARAATLIPLLRDRPRLKGAATAYVCENYACQTPVATKRDLLSQLEAMASKPPNLAS
jgi:uncharacterized protein YyaL (SSP411 family)